MHLRDERVTTQGRKERKKERKKEGENRKEREKDGRKENEGESEREGTANERGRKRSTQYALKLTTVSSLELIQESVSCCLLRPLLTTSYFGNHGL